MNETELFKMLFNAYYEKVCRSTYLIVQNEHIARDATQEAFIAAYKHLNNLKDLDNMYSWLTVVAANEAKNMIKKHANCIPITDINEFENTNSANSIEQKDNEIDTMHALSIIDIKYREVIVFKYYLGLSEKEIGATLDLPSGTVKSRLSRARIILKDILEPDTESGVVL